VRGWLFNVMAVWAGIHQHTPCAAHRPRFVSPCDDMQYNITLRDPFDVCPDNGRGARHISVFVFSARAGVQ